MTIPASEPQKVTANGNGVATTFSFSPMVIFEADDLVVTHVTAAGVETTIPEGTGASAYAITVSSYPGTGSITYPQDEVTPLPIGEKLVMKAVVTLEQETDLENQGGYFPDTLETQLDKVVKQNIQQQEELDRSTKLPIGVSGVSAELPVPVADRQLGWNSTATAITNLASAGSLATTAFTESLLDDTTAEAFRDTLWTDAAEGDLTVAEASGSKLLNAPSNDGSLLYRNNATTGKLKWATTGPSANQVPDSDGTDWLFKYPPDNSLFRMGVPVNCRIGAALSTNDLVVTLYGNDGNAPSATNPVWIPFRSTTATTGGFTWAKQTATETVTLPSTGTLGAVASQSIRVYVYAMLNGTDDVELAISRQALWDGSAVVSTTAIGTGSDDNTTLYSTSARTSKPVCLIGVLEITSTSTPGQWTSVDAVADWRPGMRKTGDVVQVQTASESSASSTTAVIPLDATLPQSSEGTAVSGLELTITPTSSLNIIHHETWIFSAVANPSWNVTAIFLNSETDARHCVAETHNVASHGGVYPTFFFMVADTTSAMTWKVRFGSNAGVAAYLNSSDGSTDTFSTAGTSWARVREIYA